MRNIKYISILLIFSFLLIISGCGTRTVVEKQSSSSETVLLSPDKIVVYSKFIPLNMDEKLEYSLNASVLPETASNAKLTYSSSDSNIAEVSQDGIVKIKQEGLAFIKITCESDTSIYSRIAVLGYKKISEENSIPVKAVSVEKTYISLTKGGVNTYEIISGVRPTDASNKELVFLSIDDYIVSVDDTGLIKGLNIGSAEIIVYSKSDPSKYSLINVDVTASASDEFTPPADVKELNLSQNPLSLIGKYQVLEYSINDGVYQKVSDDSNLRVNVDLNELAKKTVNILMYVKLNGNEAKLIQKITFETLDITGMFTSLGADITGKYTMNFTLSPEKYSQIAKQGVVKTGEKLVLKIGKVEDYPATKGLGDDIEFNMDSVPVEEGGNNNGETGADDEVSTAIDVESITFDKTKYTALKVNETFKINASILPENATRKTLKWISSDNDSASVDESGNVTVYKNKAVTITASAESGVSASLELVPVEKIDDFALDVDKKDFIQEIDESFQITYTVFPFIMQNDSRVVKYTSSNDEIVTVNENGLVTAVNTGEAYISVEIEGIERQLFVQVLPKSAGSIPVTDIELSETEGRYAPTIGTVKIDVTVVPSNAGDKRLKYESSNKEVADVNQSGIITVYKTGETDITITSLNNRDVSKVYHLVIETLPTKIVFERNDYGVALNGTETITPEFEGNPSNREVTYSIEDTSIAAVDEKTGTVKGLSIGSTKLKAVSSNGLETETTINVYTPVEKGKVETLAGTYEILDFTQTNGTLDVGTKEYGGVERMIGEMTISVSGNTVKIISKIQMDSSVMDGYNSVGSDDAHKGQFKYTEYSPAEYNADGFGTPGEKSAQVTHDNDMLKLYQQWSVIVVDVKVNTWIKKKSDTVKDLQPNTLYWSKNGIDGKGSANALKYYDNLSAPEKEPYYTYGLITLQ